MSQVTKFAARDPGASARMAGFMAHLRDNGLRLGVREAQTALSALTQIKASDPNEARRALRAVCTGCVEDAERFDDLFEAFWMRGLKAFTPQIGQRAKTPPPGPARPPHRMRTMPMPRGMARANWSQALYRQR
jgi:uncharacterized protein with von Willebrand factor type A (vWA) domain